MQRQDWVLASLKVVYDIISPDSHIKEISFSLGLLQGFDMTVMQQVKAALDIDNFICGLGLTVVTEMHDSSRRCQEVRIRDADCRCFTCWWQGCMETGFLLSFFILNSSYFFNVFWRDHRLVNGSSSLSTLRHVIFRKQQKLSYDISSWYSFGSLKHLESTLVREHLAHVSAISSDAWIISMGIILAIITIENIDTHTVLSVFMNLINPLACTDNICSLLAIQHRWALVLKNLSIWIHTNNQDVTKSLCLPNGIVMARVDEVEAAIDINSYWLFLRL